MDRKCSKCEWWQADMRQEETGCFKEESVSFRWIDSDTIPKKRIKWYYKYRYTPLSSGECRKRCPVLSGTLTDSSADFQKYSVIVSGKSNTEWPQTTEDHWCGEFVSSYSKE